MGRGFSWGHRAAGSACFLLATSKGEDSSASCSISDDSLGTKRVKTVCDASEQMMRETEINIDVGLAKVGRSKEIQG